MSNHPHTHSTHTVTHTNAHSLYKHICVSCFNNFAGVDVFIFAHFQPPNSTAAPLLALPFAFSLLCPVLAICSLPEGSLLSPPPFHLLLLSAFLSVAFVCINYISLVVVLIVACSLAIVAPLPCCFYLPLSLVIVAVLIVVVFFTCYEEHLSLICFIKLSHLYLKCLSHLYLKCAAVSQSTHAHTHTQAHTLVKFFYRNLVKTFISELFFFVWFCLI